MRTTTKLSLTVALAALVTGAAQLTASAQGHAAKTVIRLTVPINAVRAHGTDIAPKGPSAGDGFQESYIATQPGELRRQDAIGIATFQRGIFLGTITLNNGQIVYAGSTNNQDNTAYAILGGTGTYQTARGTLTTHPLPHGRLQITIATND
jgi:hypothetical protein